MIVQTCSHLSHNDLHIFLGRICVQRDKAKVSQNQLDPSLTRERLRMYVHSFTEYVEEESLKKISV